MGAFFLPAKTVFAPAVQCPCIQCEMNKSHSLSRTMAFLFDGKYFSPAKNGFYGNKRDYALEKLRIARHYVNLEMYRKGRGHLRFKECVVSKSAFFQEGNAFTELWKSLLKVWITHSKTLLLKKLC